MVFIDFYKKNCFYKRKSLDKRNCLVYIAINHCHEKKCFIQFLPEIRNCEGPSFFLKIPSQKSRSSWFPSRTVKYISQEYHNFSFKYLHTARWYCMKTESGLVYSNMSIYANLNRKPNAKIRGIYTLNSY